MATGYYVEKIERITEQMLEEEIISETNAIMWDADKKIKDIKASAIDEIGRIKPDAIQQIESIKADAVAQIEKLRDDYLSYSVGEKRDMVLKLTDSGIRGDLKKLDADTAEIYEKIKVVAPDTETRIIKNVRKMIVDNGYEITTTNDGDGNVTVDIEKVG